MSWPNVLIRRSAWGVSRPGGISHQASTASLGSDLTRAGGGRSDSTSAGPPPWTWGPTTAWATQFDSLQDFNIFTYLDVNGNTTSTPSAVRTIVINALVEPKAGRGKQVAYSTRVTIRSTRS